MPLFSFNIRSAISQSESGAARAAGLAEQARNEAERLLSQKPIDVNDVYTGYAESQQEQNLMLNKIESEYVAPLEELTRIEGLQKKLSAFQFRLPTGEK